MRYITWGILPHNKKQSSGGRTMANETIAARYQVKDENNNAVLDAEGKAMWQECSVEYDLGDTLDGAAEKFGSDVVFSQFKANARVVIQGIIRAKLKAGLTPEKIQEFISTYVLGVAVEKTQVDPVAAVKAAFATWTPEKQKEYLRELGVAVD